MGGCNDANGVDTSVGVGLALSTQLELDQRWDINVVVLLSNSTM